MPDTHSPDTDFRWTFAPKEFSVGGGEYVHATLTADAARKLRDALVYEYPIVAAKEPAESFEASHELNGGWGVWRKRAVPIIERTCIASDLNEKYANIFVNALNAKAQA
jgi:hypothetical protein